LRRAESHEAKFVLTLDVVGIRGLQSGDSSPQAARLLESSANVADDSGHAIKVAMIVAQQDDGEFDRNTSAVLRYRRNGQEISRAISRSPGGHHFCKSRIVAVVQICRNDQIQGQANRLVRCKSEYPHGARIPKTNNSTTIDRDDRIGVSGEKFPSKTIDIHDNLHSILWPRRFEPAFIITCRAVPAIC
jgi:hypothetical protein